MLVFDVHILVQLRSSSIFLLACIVWETRTRMLNLLTSFSSVPPRGTTTTHHMKRLRLKRENETRSRYAPHVLLFSSRPRWLKGKLG